MDTSEERIALFMDFENLAIGAREDLKGAKFDMKPVADALAERGRVVVRRAYADWNLFEEYRRMLAEHHVEMIEIPQRMGASRKNAADIKMAVDAVELSFEREYITTYVIATGDSDFTPLVHKLRELNRRVVGIGLRASTSALLPPACDEFLFYDSLDGVDMPQKTRRRRRGEATTTSEAPTTAVATPEEPADLDQFVTQTLSGLQRSGDTVVLASGLKRALLRKDPTFNEADHGFRTFGELLRSLAGRGVVEVGDSGSRGDPEVSFKSSGGQDEHAFDLLRKVIAKGKGPVPLSGIKDKIRKMEPSFSEKAYGYGSFLQFSRAAAARGVMTMDWSEEIDDYLLALPS